MGLGPLSGGGGGASGRWAPQGGATQGACRQQIMCHQWQQWWWPPLDLSAAPPRGPAIDVFFYNFGGLCRIYRQHPQGVRHRRLAIGGSYC
jgi:hypothetical protein